MGKKTEKKTEAPTQEKLKKKVVSKARTTKKAVSTKPQSKKPAKAKVMEQPKKKMVAKSKASKKLSAAKPTKVKQPKAASKTQKKAVEAKTVKTSVIKKVKKESTPKKIERSLSLRNAKLILEPSKRKKIRKTKVVLEGDLSINNVDAFMSQIEPIFDDYDYVDFYQREVTALDLCHIQMLYYFKNHPTRKGKTVTINSELSTDLKKVVTNAGFKEFMFIPKLV